MMTTAEFIHELAECEDVALVGGKGANLGKLVRAGFPVPGGFVVDTRAFVRAQKARRDDARRDATPLHEGSMHELPAEVAEEICEAYRAMGGGAVAVRSSATAEDMAAASMAGQYETFLNVEGEAELLRKVRECWASLDSPRIRAYLAEHGIDQARVAMAVVVQRLVPAEVAGVLFTVNPNGAVRHRQDADATGADATPEMLIEASWGLGESVVSGRVQPDVLRVNGATGAVLEAVIADKKTLLAAGSHEETEVEAALRKKACLAEEHVRQLWELGKKAAEHFGVPQDIEWAIAEAKVYLLQSRAITTHAEMEAYDEVVATTQAQLRKAVAAGRGPWAVHNLGETLPHPTPLTWSVIKRFMSGAGGYGAMYRQAGFEPSPAVCREGFLDLIAGRIYMDASRAPEMFFENFPFAYDVEELKHSPDASQNPPTVAKGPVKARIAAMKRLHVVNTKLRALSEELDRTLRETEFPEMAEYAAEARQKRLEERSVEDLIACWQHHEKRVMDEFAPHSLLPSLICGMAMGELRAFLEEYFWEEDPDALVQLLSSGGLANRTVMADAELYDLALGRHSLEEWLAEHGHRAVGEFDLAAPRWREQPAALLEMAQRMVQGERPLERHRKTSEEVQKRVAVLRQKLNGDEVLEFDRRLELVRRYVPFREDGKDYLMRGYYLLRAVALEAGRRLQLGADVFYLTREEVFAALRAGAASRELVERRKLIHRAEARVTLPHVLDGPAIEKLGAAPEVRKAAGGHKAFAVSAGVAKGPAKILLSPTEAGTLEKGYILVCPSTDPSWTPLFVNAAGLILECGGVLSHGAVVAREMGLPAVVVPDATKLFHDGQEVLVDGTAGWAGPAAEQGAAETVDPQDMQVPRSMVPPVAGPKDRRAAQLRNRFALGWVAYLLLFFLLPPAWVSQPTLVLLDKLLWPLVRVAGKPATVALVAAGIAIVTLLMQKLLTDNVRLVEAKRRAAILSKQAFTLPAGSPRRRVLERLAAPVQLRTLLAALVPVGILLGPMVMPFMWFKDRVDPLAANAPAGSSVQIVAAVDADWSGPVTLNVPPGMAPDETTPVTQTPPAIRLTLQRLLALYQQATGAEKPWQVAAGPDVPAAAAAADLEAYLEHGIPPQPMRWMIRPPENYAGQFAVTVATGRQILPVNVALGDEYPPAPTLVPGAAKEAIKDVQIVYGKANTETFFLRPFAFLASPEDAAAKTGGWQGKLAMWDMGWIWLYIIAYLPVLFITRAVLRVA